MLDNKKICFIACVNDNRKWEECLYYLNRLIIPPGFDVDVICVENAPSMTAGYNEGMNSSEAKYKIYLHQDVYITDRYYLCEIIDIFRNNKNVGMIGVTGTVKFPKDGCMFNKPRITSAYCNSNYCFDNSEEYTAPVNIIRVSMCDGLLLATQYDIPWRDDVFKGWDHYDSSQSVEFAIRGYSVVIPIFNKPICIHNDGEVLTLTYYSKWTDLFLREYKEYIVSLDNDLIDDDKTFEIYSEAVYRKYDESAKELARKIDDYLVAGKYMMDEEYNIFLNPQMYELVDKNREILVLVNCGLIAKQEKTEKSQSNILLGRQRNDLVKIYDEIMFFLWKIICGVDIDEQIMVLMRLLKNNVSLHAILCVLYFSNCIYNKNAIEDKIIMLLNNIKDDV